MPDDELVQLLKEARRLDYLAANVTDDSVADKFREEARELYERIGRIEQERESNPG